MKTKTALLLCLLGAIAIAAQPSDIADWDTSASNLLKPPGGQITSGWTNGQKPIPSNWFNWWMNIVGQWIEYLKAGDFTQGPSISSNQCGARGTGQTDTGSGGGEGLDAVGGPSTRNAGFGGEGLDGRGGAASGFLAAAGNGVHGIGGNATGDGGVAGAGVWGQGGQAAPGNDGPGVLGTTAHTAAGVQGQSSGAGVAVFGQALGTAQAGVFTGNASATACLSTAMGNQFAFEGQATAGAGVHGEATTGIGVDAKASGTAGNALKATTTNASAGPAALFVAPSGAAHGPLEVAPQASAPTSPVEGEIYYDLTTHHFFGWNGAWKQLDN